MPEISAEYLRQQIAGMRETIASFQGAIQFAEHLLGELERTEDGISLDEFAEAVGGAGATAEITPQKGEDV